MTPSDRAAWPLPERQAFGFRRTAQYVRMPDGVRLATYLFLPTGLKDGTKVGTIVIPTPYFSLAAFRSPLFERLVAALSIAGQTEWAEAFARFGYATLLWDLRGGGASFGQKRGDGTAETIEDTRSILDWIVAQPWSNGRVGATGISARGMIAQWMAAAGHPALKAIVPRFTAFDIYTATHAGGLTPTRFIRDIGKLLRAMDAGRLHDLPESRAARALLRLLGMRVMPMDEDPRGDLLKAAFKDHETNRYLDRDLVRIVHRDDLLESADAPVTLDTQSPLAFAREIQASGTAIYAQAGWFDGPFCAEMLSLHNTVRGAGDRIVIGPWGHHGKFQCSPSLDTKRPSAFDHAADIVRFFDLHLNETPRGEAGPNVRYYTTGRELWNDSPAWPPPGIRERRFYLSAEHTLSGAPPLGDGHDAWRVDGSATTGPHSRFGKHREGGRFPVTYPDRPSADRKLLVYTSEPLPEAIEVTGHPVLTLFIRSDSRDGAFLAYLEDVAPGGRVAVVTDGGLRALFRKLAEKGSAAWRGGPYRSCERKDALPLVPGAVTELTFDLYPTSHLFLAGHRIRLAISGADRDNFSPIAGCETPRIEVLRGEAFPSSILLPVLD